MWSLQRRGRDCSTPDAAMLCTEPDEETNLICPTGIRDKSLFRNDPETICGKSTENTNMRKEIAIAQFFSNLELQV
jgi:hypothetical protein